MHKNSIEVIVALAGALLLQGCGGGGGGGGGTNVSVLPSTANGLDGMGDYLNSGGSWQVNLDGQYSTTTKGTASLSNALVYDGTADTWTLNIDGADHTLGNVTANSYNNSPHPDCLPTCFTFNIYDDDGDPATAQYGTFAEVRFLTATVFGVIYTSAGLKTPVMPTSATGTYSGTFDGWVLGSSVASQITGPATVTANFDAGTTNLTSDGTGTGPGPATYSLAGTGTITGNTYLGTASGWFNDGVSTTVTFTTTNSSLSGAFYGPDQTMGGETAGVIYSTDAAGTNEIVGGFWAVRTGP
ncbi:MAG: transferrin-binding protein-like solute binding protein [Alphaproteobacteria bacterium]|nr:transferrin-binding protein-like solute binding protein [Alphaproteobacteria bacterium]